MARCILIAVLFAIILIRPSTAAAENTAVRCNQLPVNILVASTYRAWIVDLVARSPTLSRQCEAIARHPGVRVALDSTRRLIGFDRARTSFFRDDAGTLQATITIPMTRDFAELLAHELEHVLEQLEGVNLRRMAQVRDSGVREVGRNVFETSRAVEAGRAAAGETRACRDAGTPGCVGFQATLIAASKD